MTDNEKLLGFASLDLAHLRSHFQAIAGSWNGEDDRFIHEDNAYHADHAASAIEIVDQIDKLDSLLAEFSNI